MSSLLTVKNLRVSFERPEGEQEVIRGIDLNVARGEVLALVGESGCGKTVLCKTITRLLCRRGRIRSGRILLDGRDLALLTEHETEKCRGGSIGMIFQDPMTSLDPTMRIGDQIAEAAELHLGLGRGAARAKAAELLTRVGLDGAAAAQMYPHQFSGGMRQRAAIAIALAGEPQLLLADEPTTALDCDSRKRIPELLKDIQRERGLAIIFITHDLSLVEGFADRIAVMKDGLIAEIGKTEDIFAAPTHEYTRRLISYLNYGRGIGHSHGDSTRGERSPAVQIRGLSKSFGSKNVFGNLDMDIYEGELLGISGPSGCGKTTLARCIMGIETQAAGTVEFPKIERLKRTMIFQDSASAFNERMSVQRIIEEPLRILNGRRPHKDKVRELMELVELPFELADRRPYEISGGQRQRVAIARALSTDPEFIIADEPIASLDISVQSQIVHLFKRLQEQRRLTIALISHDLPMIVHVADRMFKM